MRVYKNWNKSGHTGVFDFDYQEHEDEETVTITTTLTFKKKNKLAVRKLDKAEEKGILPLTLILKDIEADRRAEKRDREK